MAFERQNVLSDLRIRWAMILLTGVIIVLSFAFRDYVQDDVFITYTYSRNLADGVGFVFNPGEAVQGTTTPLWTLVVAAAHLLPFAALHTGNLLSAIFLLLTCLFAVALLRAWTGIAAALLIATSPLHYASFGMETMLYCALLVAAFYSWSRGRLGLAAALAGLLTWTRADGVVLGGTLCLLAFFDTIQQTRKTGLALWSALRLGIVYLIVIAPWFLFAWAYFGSPLPNTFGAKQEFLRGIDFLVDGIERWQTFYESSPPAALNLLAIPLIGVGAWTAFGNWRLRPVVMWSALYAIGYTALNITNFWYYTPLVTGLILLTALGGALVLQKFIGKSDAQERVSANGQTDAQKRVLAVGRTDAQKRVIAVVVGIIVVVVAVVNAARAAELSPPPPRMATYQLAGTWIDQHTAPDSSLLVADLGIVGYYAHRRTIDSFGLIVPDLPVKTPEYAAQTFQPDLILATQYFLWRFTADSWFRDAYAPLTAFSTPGDGEFSPMTLYRRRTESLAMPVSMQAIETEPTAAWEPFAALVHAELPVDLVWSGGELDLSLTWRGMGAADRDYTVFVHVVPNAETPPIAQRDAPPTIPTSEWRTGETYIETYRVIVPPDTPAGHYAVRLGWYAGDTRVPVDGDDALHLTDIEVRFPGGSGRP